MTTTAKILVVLNLLLAVLFLGFSAATMNGRLGLEQRITTLEKEKKKAADDVAVEQLAANKSDAESKQLSMQFNLLKKQSDDQQKQASNQIDNLTSDNANLRKEADVGVERL